MPAPSVLRLAEAAAGGCGVGGGGGGNSASGDDLITRSLRAAKEAGPESCPPIRKPETDADGDERGGVGERVSEGERESGREREGEREREEGRESEWRPASLFLPGNQRESVRVPPTAQCPPRSCRDRSGQGLGRGGERPSQGGLKDLAKAEGG